MLKKILLLSVFNLFLFSPHNIIAAENVPEEWITLFEKSNYLESPEYDEAIAYFQKIADNSEYAKLIEIGVSPQGRSIKCLIVSKDKAFTHEKARELKKPIILIQNGTHPGEIMGMDASMILLREILITKEKESLIDNTILLVIPVVSPDGHCRRSPYGRINQIGPKEMGWRVTAQNLNLNRDYLKADAPEMRAFLKLYSEWLPEMFIDNHSTDGADFQYHITYTIEKHENVPPFMAKWATDVYSPYLKRRVEEEGYLISPFVGFLEGDVKNGMRDWIPIPRFSNGYAVIQNRPGMLIESHVLKTYRDRVYSTKAALQAVVELYNAHPTEIMELVKRTDEYVREKYVVNNEPYPLTFKRTKEHTTYKYKGIEYEMKYSPITGDSVKVYTGEKFEKEVPYYNHGVADETVLLPNGYLIPKEWNSIIAIMKMHGIEIEELKENKRYAVEKYKFSNVKYREKPYEGRFLPSYDFDMYRDTVTVSSGDYYVPIDQRAFTVAAHALEPNGPDSFAGWGYFNIIFEQKEYYEDYAMEPVARKMLNEDPELKKEFETKLKTDEAFRNDPRARLDYFYERSPYYDKAYLQYPVMRVVSEIK